MDDSENRNQDEGEERSFDDAEQTRSPEPFTILFTSMEDGTEYITGAIAVIERNGVVQRGTTRGGNVQFTMYRHLVYKLAVVHADYKSLFEGRFNPANASFTLSKGRGITGSFEFNYSTWISTHVE